MEPMAGWTEWQYALTITAALVAGYALMMWIAAVIWTYRDIRARTTDRFERFSSVAVVALFNIPGLFLHVLMRPRTTLDEQMDRRLEAEAMFQDLQEHPACPQCAGRVDADFILCPFCRAELRSPCRQCGRALAADWVMCPFCATEKAPAAAPRSRPVSPEPRPVRGARAPRPAFAMDRPRG